MLICVTVPVEAVVKELPLLIDREAGLRGERTGKGGEPGVGGRAMESCGITFWRLWGSKPGGGLAMPTRRERGVVVESSRASSPADTIVEISSILCSGFEV